MEVAEMEGPLHIHVPRVTLAWAGDVTLFPKPCRCTSALTSCARERSIGGRRKGALTGLRLRCFLLAGLGALFVVMNICRRTLTRDLAPTRVARDPRFERLACSHTGTYADDCLVQRVTSHKCYIVATCDRELRRRIRKIPGVPLMYIVRRRYAIERLPDQGAPV